MVCVYVYNFKAFNFQIGHRSNINTIFSFCLYWTAHWIWRLKIGSVANISLKSEVLISLQYCTELITAKKMFYDNGYRFFMADFFFFQSSQLFFVLMKSAKVKFGNLSSILCLRRKSLFSTTVKMQKAAVIF